MSQVGDNEIIHHMDLFACQKEVEASFPSDSDDRNNWCSTVEFLYDYCSHLVWAYDRGVLTYTFADDVGILLGPSTGYTHFLFQAHYLMPEHYPVGQGKGVMDQSGFDIVVSHTKIHDSYMIELAEMTMLVPPRNTKYHYKAHLPAEKLNDMIGADLDQFGEVQPFAAHLHAHDNAISVFLEHYRNGEVLYKTSIDPFHGMLNSKLFRKIINQCI